MGQGGQTVQRPWYIERCGQGNLPSIPPSLSRVLGQRPHTLRYSSKPPGTEKPEGPRFPGASEYLETQKPYVNLLLAIASRGAQELREARGLCYTPVHRVLRSQKTHSAIPEGCSMSTDASWHLGIHKGTSPSSGVMNRETREMGRQGKGLELFAGAHG